MTQQTRQKAYIAKRKKKKLCLRCKNKAMKSKVLCKACTINRREYQRQRTGSRPWRKGGRGRPPIYK